MVVFFTYENRNKSDKDTIIKFDAGMCKIRHGVANYVNDIPYLDDRHYTKKDNVRLGSDGKEYYGAEQHFTCSKDAQ